jgi:sulfate adenylyltransferase subunit 2
MTRRACASCPATRSRRPASGAIASDAADLPQIVRETLLASVSERQGRISDGEDGGSLEQKKREGYF